MNELFKKVFQTSTSSGSEDEDSFSSDESHFDKEKEDSQLIDVKCIDIFPRYKGDSKVPVRFSRMCRSCLEVIHPRTLVKACFECKYMLCDNCYSVPGNGKMHKVPHPWAYRKAVFAGVLSRICVDFEYTIFSFLFDCTSTTTH